MTSKTQLLATPWVGKEKHLKNKRTHFTFIDHHPTYTIIFFVFLSAWFLMLFFWFPSTQYANNDQKPKTNTTITTTTTTTTTTESVAPTCDQNISVYVYDLPAEFNRGLLKDCAHLNVYTNMCPHVASHGLGQPLIDIKEGSNDWFATHQFIAEMIFHARVENHPCRTWDPTHANLFYVPLYGGLHASSKFHEYNHTIRDELAVRLVDYLHRQHWWQRHHGKDHFLVLGRTAWDFMRSDSGPDFGANSLLNMPSVKNMSVLTVERHPWQGSNQHGIPYPSYFHPSSSDQMLNWQNKMRQSERPYLFSFIGAPRKGVDKAVIRDELIKQCANSIQCKLLKCEKGASKCYEPLEVLKVMSESQFCLQAPGDSFTRRSTSDAILAGCIPVFFSPHMAYTQYAWFLPEDPNSYSVYIDERGNASKSIEKQLSKISTERVEQMRSVVIDLIPRITYAHTNARDVGFRDAVDVALASLAKHVESKLSNPVVKQP